MARRFHSRSGPGENLRIVIRSIPWKLLLLVPVLILVAIPTYVLSSHLGGNVLPGMTQMFYKLAAPPTLPSPTPFPGVSSTMPQIGSLLYTVQDGDSCDSILSTHMHMAAAGEIFSDVKPETVKALNDTLGQDCHRIQPDLVLPLSPQYPLVALGGVVLKIDPTNAQQVLPTPLIDVPGQQQYGPDCSGGCLLTVRLSSQIQIRLTVQTSLPIHVNSWVWAQAALARKAVQGFDTYPYADSKADFNGMPLRACDFQIDDVHDDNSQPCSQLTPGTIDIDGGSWLFAVTGPNALDHWHYDLHVPTGTRVLLWLSNDHGNLKFQARNAAYRYDDASHVYVKI